MADKQQYDVEVQTAVWCRVHASDYAEAREKASSRIRSALFTDPDMTTDPVQVVESIVHTGPERDQGPEELARVRRQLDGCRKQIRAFVRVVDALPLHDPEYSEGVYEDFMATMAHHSPADIRRALAMVLT